MEHTFAGRRLVRCYIYARISEDRAGAGLGCQRQIEDSYRLAASLSTSEVEYRVVDVFEDNDLSAYSGKPRPDYLRMLEGLRDHQADCVLAWHTDRLHRRPLELEQYIDICEPHRIETRTVTAGHLDLSTASGRMIARQLGVQARYETERMVERARRKKEELAEQGKFLGGARPFGWEADGRTPVAVEFTAIASSAESVLSGVSRLGVAKELNRQGILTSRGRQWDSSRMREMLLRPRNAGIQVHRGQEVGEGDWPAPLPEPTWRSVVAILEDPSRRMGPRPERVYLGTGLYLCGVCGTALRSNQGRKPGEAVVRRYECRHNAHVSRIAEYVDDFVQLAVVERLSRPDAVDLIARPDEAVDSKAAQEQLWAARRTLDDLAAAMGSGALDVRSWTVASAAARKRMEEAEALLARAVTVNPAIALLEDAETAWQGLDLARRRAVISFLMTVTILPARRGPGWDASALRIDWK